MNEPNITEASYDGGHQAEQWAAGLPNMRQRGGSRTKHDLEHKPSGARVEVKYSAVHQGPILHGLDAMWQFKWTGIYPVRLIGCS